MGLCGFSLLAAGDLAVTAAALFGATAACSCSVKFMLNFTDRRQPLATQIDKILESDARRNFTAELRGEF